MTKEFFPQSAMQRDSHSIDKQMRKFLLFLFGLLLLSCGEEIIKKPDNLIPKEKMVDIFYDLALLNAAEKNIKPILEHKETTVMEFLYQKHQIDSTQLAQSDLYYASVPLEYQSIYEQVHKILERKKDAMEQVSKKKNDSVRESRRKQRDSIKNTKVSEEVSNSDS